MRPWATSSQRVMPPKMLTSTAATGGPAKIASRAADDDLGASAAADVAEVGGAAARGGDLVDGAHHEPGAVADDADVAVQRDEREARPAGLRLAFVRGGSGARSG